MTKLITEGKFYGLPSLEDYKDIKVLDEDTLIKRTIYGDPIFLKELSSVKIDKVITPIDIYRILNTTYYLYTMTYCKEFETLDNLRKFEHNFTDKEILIFFKSLLEKVREMHKMKLSSGDMHAGNILVDENLDYRFIDFDYATTENFVGHMVLCDPLFLNNYSKKTLDSNYNTEDQIQLSDKLNLWNMILHYMMYGNVYSNRHIKKFDTFSSLELPKEVDKKLNSIFKTEQLLKPDDYLLEELDTIIKKDYKLPYRSRN